MKKRTKLFDMNKPGKGITKAQAHMEDNSGLTGFLRLYRDKFWNLSSLNLLYILANFPIFFGIAALSGNFNLETTAPSSPLYAQLFGIEQYGRTPFISALVSVIGTNGTLSVPSQTTKILALLTLLVLLTFGISNVGATYILRSFVRGEPVYMFSDFVYAVKNNIRQALIVGVLDVGMFFVLIYGIMTYYINMGTYMLNVMFFAELLLLLLYLTMRFYMYIILITFDLPISKIIKNSFIFAFIGYKRNFVAWLGIILVSIFSFYLIFYLPPVGVALPFIITIASTMFMCTFCVYPVIKQYMIDPYYAEAGDSENISDENETIFKDRG